MCRELLVRVLYYCNVMTVYNFKAIFELIFAFKNEYGSAEGSATAAAGAGERRFVSVSSGNSVIDDLCLLFVSTLFTVFRTVPPASPTSPDSSCWPSDPRTGQSSCERAASDLSIYTCIYSDYSDPMLLLTFSQSHN